ncbi:MAG: hypothetical protein FJ137_20110 [Deltaproteobacteria bacterium]|nr:hypothetical protein [Deltaproteobacteria bacterium]
MTSADVRADVRAATRQRVVGDADALAVRQRLLTDADGTAVAERRKKIRHVVDELLRTRVGEGLWTAPDGGPCLDIAAQWLPALQAAGLPARLATVDPARRPADGPPVRAGHEGKFHAFVVVGERGQEPIIVDGSWRQFVAGAEARADLEPVLVGTHADLVARFRAEQAALQVERVEDPLLGRRDAAATADLVYGAGRHATLRELLDP